jgi:two-component system cell cycle sensor histidine kinase/response regulator CckA
MHPVAIFDFVTFLASITALVILVTGWKRSFKRDVTLLLFGLFAFNLFYSFCLFMEWSGITKALDPFEDFAGALVPMWWAFVVYALLKEIAGRDLREGEEKYRNILTSIEEGYYEVDLSGNLTFFNDSMRKIFGYPRDELLGMNDREYTTPESAKKMYQIFNRVYQTGEPARITDYEIIRKDGSTSILELSTSLMRDVKGEPVGFHGVTRDITDRKKSEKELQESEERYRNLFDNISDFIYTHDLEGRFISINRAAAQTLGYAPDELIGRPISDLMIPAEFRKAFKDEYLAQIKKQGFSNGVSLYLAKDGKGHYIEYRSKVLVEGLGRDPYVSGVGRDITERIEAKRELKRLEEQLQRAQKMEAIGTLAGGVAHDLNNILSGIVSYPDLLLMQIPEDSPLRKPILTMQNSGKRAAAIVQDLLTLARRGVATKEVVNLNDVINDYLKSPEHKKIISFHSGVEFKTSLGADLLNVSGSHVHLSKTIMNLCSNAAEAMPDGGKILISTENRYIDRPISGYDSVDEGDYITLEVSDTGVGISKEDIERIFEPFYTKKQMGRSGTGLGMAVVWGTVKDHNGYIDVQSEEGKGTTFTLYFPATREEIAKEKARLSLEDYTGKGESILVVDDVKDQREIAINMLTTLGYTADAVSSGEETVQYLKERRVDLVILDMIMDPGIDGLDTYKRIIEVHPGQKAIIAGGFSETYRVKEAQRLGAGVYIKKPYTLEKIAVAVKEELGK